MKPLPRQKIYKFSVISNLIDFFTFGIFNYSKHTKLKKYLCNFFSTKNILCINRGRLGAYLAVKASINNKKKKIIMSPFTIFDVVNMVICAGGTPIFCDVEKKSITISLDYIKKVYNNEVAAILITHTHLINTDIDQISKFAKEKKILLIEDCAISFGTKLNKQPIGTIGDISFFSFGIFKFISSLNGGMILAKDNNVYDRIIKESKIFKKIDYKMIFKNYLKCLFISIATNNIIFKYLSSKVIKFGYINNIKLINNFSKNDPNPFLQTQLPEHYKKRISNSQCARILTQFPSFLNDFIIRKRNAQIYYDNLKDIDKIVIPDFVESDSNGWINFPIFYKHRDSLLRFLFLNNRDIAIYFYRNCNQLDIFKEYKNENLKNINEVVNEIIILPTYPKYEAEQIYTNIKLIKKYFQK